MLPFAFFFRKQLPRLVLFVGPPLQRPTTLVAPFAKSSGPHSTFLINASSSNRAGSYERSSSSFARATWLPSTATTTRLFRLCGAALSSNESRRSQPSAPVHKMVTAIFFGTQTRMNREYNYVCNIILAALSNYTGNNQSYRLSPLFTMTIEYVVAADWMSTLLSVGGITMVARPLPLLWQCANDVFGSGDLVVFVKGRHIDHGT
jgi:hypothetical protein